MRSASTPVSASIPRDLVGALVAGVLGGCSGASHLGAEEAAIPAVRDWALERVFAVSTGAGRASIASFDGAALSGRGVLVRDAAGAELARGAADANGRFSLDVAASAGDTIRLGAVDDPSLSIAFRVRDPASARTDAVRPSIDGAGSVPNDLLIDRSGEGVLVRSGDNAVSPFDLAHGLETGVRLPDVDFLCSAHRPANPWFAAWLDDAGDRVAVTAFLQRHVYIVDMRSTAVVGTLAVTSAVMLDAPFPLARPIDVDGDCNPDEAVTSFVPRTPQPVLAVGDHLAVGFTSFLASRIDASSPPVYLPGVLAVWKRSDLELPPMLTVLPALNPQELRAKNDREIYIVCSGVLDHHAGLTAATSPGAVIVFDLEENAVTGRYDLGDFAPGTALEAGGALWVGSLVRGAVRRIDLADPAKTVDLSIDDEAVDSTFRLVDLDGALIGAPSFDTDRLHFIDARTGVLDPAPFFGPLAVGPGRPVLDGLQIVARRPGRRGVDFTGPDLWALAGRASRVTPIELRKVLGP
jgi:hypothetical protein